MGGWCAVEDEPVKMIGIANNHVIGLAEPAKYRRAVVIESTDEPVIDVEARIIPDKSKLPVDYPAGDWTYIGTALVPFKEGMLQINSGPNAQPSSFHPWDDEPEVLPPEEEVQTAMTFQCEQLIDLGPPNPQHPTWEECQQSESEYQQALADYDPTRSDVKQALDNYVDKFPAEYLLVEKKEQ